MRCYTFYMRATVGTCQFFSFISLRFINSLCVVFLFSFLSWVCPRLCFSFCFLIRLSFVCSSVFPPSVRLRLLFSFPVSCFITMYIRLCLYVPPAFPSVCPHFLCLPSLARLPAFLRVIRSFALSVGFLLMLFFLLCVSVSPAVRVSLSL